MSMTDPIADMLTRIRNATMRRKEQVDVPASKMHENIARILLEEGYIQSYRRLDEKTQGVLQLTLKYGDKRERVIEGLERRSKPGRRLYVDKDHLPRVRNGLGIAVISTSQGILTDRECRRRGIGGEVICYIW